LSLLHSALLITALAAHFSFIWGAIKFFKVDDTGAKLGKKIISTVGSIFVLTHLYFIVVFPNDNHLRLLIAISLYLTAITIFWITVKTYNQKRPSFAYSNELPISINTQGTYKIIRHPFYTSYTLAWLAGSIGTSDWLLITLAIMFGIYYVSAKKEEVILSTGNNAELYRDYRRKTSMFIPYIF
jgi:protein-S-isoprenylcysteine O-methyltransferase Ste14